LLGWMLKHTAWGLKVRVVGESADAARALGLPVDRIRIISTAQ
jgi:general nucleoside transport system permease protein